MQHLIRLWIPDAMTDVADVTGCVPPAAPGGQADVHGELHGDGPRHRRAHVLPPVSGPIHQGLLPDPAQGPAAVHGRPKPSQGQDFHPSISR